MDTNTKITIAVFGIFFGIPAVVMWLQRVYRRNAKPKHLTLEQKKQSEIYWKEIALKKEDKQKVELKEKEQIFKKFPPQEAIDGLKNFTGNTDVDDLPF